MSARRTSCKRIPRGVSKNPAASGTRDQSGLHDHRPPMALMPTRSRMSALSPGSIQPCAAPSHASQTSFASESLPSPKCRLRTSNVSVHSSGLDTIAAMPVGAGAGGVRQSVARLSAGRESVSSVSAGGGALATGLVSMRLIVAPAGSTANSRRSLASPRTLPLRIHRCCSAGGAVGFAAQSAALSVAMVEVGVASSVKTSKGLVLLIVSGIVAAEVDAVGASEGGSQTAICAGWGQRAVGQEDAGTNVGERGALRTLGRRGDVESAERLLELPERVGVLLEEVELGAQLVALQERLECHCWVAGGLWSWSRELRTALDLRNSSCTPSRTKSSPSSSANSTLPIKPLTGQKRASTRLCGPATPSRWFAAGGCPAWSPAAVQHARQPRVRVHRSFRA